MEVTPRQMKEFGTNLHFFTFQSSIDSMAAKQGVTNIDTRQELAELVRFLKFEPNHLVGLVWLSLPVMDHHHHLLEIL